MQENCPLAGYLQMVVQDLVFVLDSMARVTKTNRPHVPNPAEPEPNRFSLPDLIRICIKFLGMLEHWNIGLKIGIGLFLNLN